MKFTALKTALFLFSAALTLNAQNVGIGTNTPAASAKLDITDPNRGVLIPRVALTATNAAGPVTAPVVSLLVYNTATAGAAPNNVSPGFYYWNGSAWVRLLNGESLDWRLTGNTATNAALNFIGTTDAVDFVTCVNNTERIRVTATGNVGIGTNTPLHMLDINPATNPVWTSNSWRGLIGLNDAAAIGWRNNFGGTRAGIGHTSNGTMALNDDAMCFFTTNSELATNGSPAVYAMKIYDQNNLVAINNGATVPDASAQLDVTSTNRGVLIPRVALTATNLAGPVTAPTTSLLVYNNATAGIAPNNVTPGYYYWNGTQWVRFQTSNTPDWTVLGNAGTIDGTNFIGTTDPVPFNIRVNNQKAGRIEFTVGTAGTFLGYQAGNINSGVRNTALGYTALSTNSTATDNTAIGANALRLNTGGQNTAVGSLAMQNNSTGYHNTSLGYQSLLSNTTGYGNTSVGYNAARAGISGIYNTALGTQALESNTTGSNNTAVGYLALFSNTASSNLAIGASALRVNTTASNNIAIGHNSLDANTTGSPNLAIGVDALGANITGANNVAIGHNTLLLNTASNNVAIGPRAMDANTSGTPNLAIGADALGVNVTGVDNIAIGVNTLAANTASNNIAIGPRALDVNTTGNVNTAMGQDALGANTSGGSNVAIGYRTLFNNTTSTANTAIGRSAGDGFAHANNNTFIGAYSDASIAGLFNSTAIGANAIVSASNAMVLGNNNVNVGIGTSNPIYAKLQVVGNAVFSQTAAGFTAGHAAYIRGNNNFSTATTPDYTWWNSDQTGMFHPAASTIAFSANGVGETMRITGAGDVGIGTTTPGGLFELSLNEGRKPLSNTWTITSDERLKTIHGNYNKGLKELMQLQPIVYHYKNVGDRIFEEEVLKTEAVGFSAQQVQKVFPEAVGTDPDGYLNFNNHAILVAYLNAIKEQQAQIQSQQSIIEAQKKELDDLKNRMERLEKLMENK